MDDKRAIYTGRRSGRTHKMLQDAFAAAEEGRAVYVVCATMRHATQLRRENQARADALGVKFETRETLGRTFRPESMALLGAHPNCRLFMDHRAIEREMGAMADQWRRYCLEETEVEDGSITDADRKA